MICDNCGIEFDEATQFLINTGRRVQHLCPKCYTKGQNDTGRRQAERRLLLRKEMQKRK